MFKKYFQILFFILMSMGYQFWTILCSHGLNLSISDLSGEFGVLFLYGCSHENYKIMIEWKRRICIKSIINHHQLFQLLSLELYKMYECQRFSCTIFSLLTTRRPPYGINRILYSSLILHYCPLLSPLKKKLYCQAMLPIRNSFRIWNVLIFLPFFSFFLYLLVMLRT